MNGQTHTQGPWRRVGHRTVAAGAGINRVTICELYSWGDCTEADANEALIAAAPDLFAAAEAAAAVLAKGKWIPDAPDPEAVALCQLLRALDLARGVVVASDGPPPVRLRSQAIDALAAPLPKVTRSGGAAS